MNKMSVSYWPERNKEFSVEVKAWFDGKWNWNIYAYILPEYDQYHDNRYLKSIDMHGGVTFDELVIRQPIDGIKYDFQRIKESKVVGCDFAHLYDDYDNHPSPFEYSEGVIPEPFLSHAERLIKHLKIDANQD